MNIPTKIVLQAGLFTLITLGLGCGNAQKKDDKFYTSGNREADQRAEQRMAKDAQLKGGKEDDSRGMFDNQNGKELTGPNGVPKADEKKTLYDRLGGSGGVDAIVADWVTRVMADPTVNFERKGVKQGGISIHRGRSLEWNASDENISRLKQHVAQFIAIKTGGPTSYSGEEMKQVHSGLRITNTEFDASIGALKATLDKLQIPNDEQKELLAIFESTRTQVVEER